MLELAKNTDELKKLIAEHPDYDIVVLAGEEANIGDFYWMYCSEITFRLGEILDCAFVNDDDSVFTDREALELKIEDDLYEAYCDKSNEEYGDAIKARMAELEPYWKNVIFIYADN